MKDAQGLDVNIGDRVVVKHGGKFLLGHVATIKERTIGADGERTAYTAKVVLEKPYVREKLTWTGRAKYDREEITVTSKTVTQYSEDYAVVVLCPETKR